jgi:hypothetical protein
MDGDACVGTLSLSLWLSLTLTAPELTLSKRGLTPFSVTRLVHRRSQWQRVHNLRLCLKQLVQSLLHPFR